MLFNICLEYHFINIEYKFVMACRIEYRWLQTFFGDVKFIIVKVFDIIHWCFNRLWAQAISANYVF